MTGTLTLDNDDWRIISATGLLSRKEEFPAHLGLLLSEFRDGIHSGSPVGRWWVVNHAGALNFVRAKTSGVRPLGTIDVEQRTEVYRGFTIQPKRDFGSTPYFLDGRNVWHGWNVVSQDGCNALPGATWGRTIADARRLADCLLLAGGTAERGDAGMKGGSCDRFWSLVDASAKKVKA